MRWIAVRVGLHRPQVVNVDHLLCLRRRGRAACPASRRPDHRLAVAYFGKCRRRAVQRHRAERVAFEQEQVAELGLADARRVLQHGIEHRLKLARRAADDLQHLRGRGLLLQRLAQIVGALLQFVEQPRVLDGDDGLGGEVLSSSICLSVNGRTSWRVDADGADQLRPRAASARRGCCDSRRRAPIASTAAETSRIGLDIACGTCGSPACSRAGCEFRMTTRRGE